jgi:hypothetical protein
MPIWRYTGNSAVLGRWSSIYGLGSRSFNSAFNNTPGELMDLANGTRVDMAGFAEAIRPVFPGLVGARSSEATPVVPIAPQSVKYN